MWLLKKLILDFKTIAVFRKDHAAVFKPVFRDFTLLCKELELFGGELVAIDGSKFKAVNNKDRNFTQPKLQRLLGEIETKINGYLQQLEQGDKADAAEHKADAAEHTASSVPASDPAPADKREQLPAKIGARRWWSILLARSSTGGITVTF